MQSKSANGKSAQDKEAMWGRFGEIVKALVAARENFWGLVESQNLAPWAVGEARINAEPRVIESVCSRANAATLCDLLETDYCRMIEHRNELVDMLLPVIKRDARRMAQKYNLSMMSGDDLVQQGALAVIKGSHHVSADVDGAAFSAYRYLYRCICNEMTRAATREFRDNECCCSLDVADEDGEGLLNLMENIPSEEPAADDNMARERILKDFRKYWRSQPEKLQVIELLLEGRSDTQIAEQMSSMNISEIRRICADAKSMAQTRM